MTYSNEGLESAVITIAGGGPDAPMGTTPDREDEEDTTTGDATTALEL